MFDTPDFPFANAAAESETIETPSFMAEADQEMTDEAPKKRTRTKQPDIPSEAYGYVLEHYTTETPEQIAAKFGINPAQVNRIANTLKKSLRNKVEGASDEAKAQVEEYIATKLTRTRARAEKVSRRSAFKENVSTSVDSILSSLGIATN